MNKQNTTVMKLAETALLAALCYVSFTFLQIKIPVPGGDATSLHIGNTFCVLGALLLGGWYGGLAGAILSDVRGMYGNAGRQVLLSAPTRLPVYYQPQL